MLVFALKGRQGRPQSPFLLYDGGRHATFYRRPNEVILIDYINDRVLCELSKAKQILIVEIDRERNCVVGDYFARIKHVEKNNLTDGLDLVSQNKTASRKFVRGGCCSFTFSFSEQWSGCL